MSRQRTLPHIGVAPFLLLQAYVCVWACTDSRLGRNALLTWQTQLPIPFQIQGNGACNQVEKLADAIGAWSWVIRVATCSTCGRWTDDSPQQWAPPTANGTRQQ